MLRYCQASYPVGQSAQTHSCQESSRQRSKGDRQYDQLYTCHNICTTVRRLQDQLFSLEQEKKKNFRVLRGDPAAGGSLHIAIITIIASASPRCSEFDMLEITSMNRANVLHQTSHCMRIVRKEPGSKESQPELSCGTCHRSVDGYEVVPVLCSRSEPAWDDCR